MKTLVERALESRRMIFQTAGIASVVALGINLVAAWLSELLKVSQLALVAIGLLCVALGFLYFARELLSGRALTMSGKGVFLLDSEDTTMTPIYRYRFSEDLTRTIKAATVENEALKLAWEQEMFPKKDAKTEPKEDQSAQGPTQNSEIRYATVIKIPMTSATDEQRPRSSRILLEAVEFQFLEYLSLHLSDYFDSEAGDAGVQLFERKNIPEMVLSNRLLSLLTTPIEDRAIFVTSGMHRNPPQGEIHSIIASNGARYEKFHLYLPAKTKISRPRDGVLVLQHPRFEMMFEAIYHGFGHTFPRLFRDYYVSSSQHELSARFISIRLSATLTPLSYFRVNGWTYYRWIDSFFEYFQENTSFEAFLEKINWESVATHIRATGIIETRKKRAREDAARAAKAEAAPVNPQPATSDETPVSSTKH